MQLVGDLVEVRVDMPATGQPLGEAVQVNVDCNSQCLFIAFYLQRTENKTSLQLFMTFHKYWLCILAPNNKENIGISFDGPMLYQPELRHPCSVFLIFSCLISL